jgi:OPA family sugar phosphate sensor protein UhpC-like MFS transporter
MSMTSAESPAEVNADRALAFRRQQAAMIGTMYAGYATSMLLRMIPTVAGNPIRDDVSLGIDLETWGQVLAAGTTGAMMGKFLCGWAADTFGGRKTFTIALCVASIAVGLFSMSSSLLAFQATFFLTMMAQAAGWPSMTKIITNWASPRQYGRVWGILSTSSRVGTLTATFLLGSLLDWISWREMLWIAAALGGCIALFYGLKMRDRPAMPIPDEDASPSGETTTADRPPHPFDDLTLRQALPRIFASLRFWLIACSLMGLTILWDYLIVVPQFLKDTYGLSLAQASRAASAIPLGSLISVLAGGYVFDRLDRKTMGIVMAGLLTVATGCLLLLATLGTGTNVMLVVLPLLFLFGLCVSPCYYIPCSVFSIDFGGRHSGFLVAILDAIGFAATATFYVFGTALAKRMGWTMFLYVLAGVGAWSLVTTYFFMQREGRTIRRRRKAESGERKAGENS